MPTETSFLIDEQQEGLREMHIATTESKDL